MSRTNAILPDPLKEILDLRKSDLKCRPDVEVALAKYGLIRVAKAAPSGPAGVPAGVPGPSGPSRTLTAPTPMPYRSEQSQSTSRFTNIGHIAAPDGWRTKAREMPKEDESWTTATPRKKHSGGHSSGYAGGHSSGHSSGGYAGGHSSGYAHSNNNSGGSFRRSGPSHTSYSDRTTTATATTATATTATTATATTATGEPAQQQQTLGAGVGAWKSSRFQPLEETIATESMDDRIMGKVRAKVNKLGASTYDATKSFMKQILDSGETEFLEEFMRFVFGKAATETAFCGLYARFLHELADEFPHLRDAMVRKFREYTRVFDDASKAPDVGTSDYIAFVEAQEQKKFRRGYSQFVAELAKLGEVSMEDFRLLVNRIVDTIQVSCNNENNRTMCEEVIDCFQMMVRAAKVDWMKEYVETLRSMVNASRDAAPGLSNKGRFALMDILDLVAKRR